MDRSRCLLPRDPSGKRYGKHARVKALVMSVETYSVSVEPVAHADTGGLPADWHGAAWLPPSELLLLEHFASTMWQVGH